MKTYEQGVVDGLREAADMVQAFSFVSSLDTLVLAYKSAAEELGEHANKREQGMSAPPPLNVPYDGVANKAQYEAEAAHAAQAETEQVATPDTAVWTMTQYLNAKDELHNCHTFVVTKQDHDAALQAALIEGTRKERERVAAWMRNGNYAAVSKWISIEDRLPVPQLSVLIIHRGQVRIGEIRWDYPGYEDTYEAFQYWDDPVNDGQVWEWHDVTYWMPIPILPNDVYQY